MSAPGTGRSKRPPPPRPRQPPRRARQDAGSPLPTGSLQTSQHTADQGLPLPNNFAVESSLNPKTHACSDSSREKDASAAAGHGHDSDVVSRTEAKTHNQERPVTSSEDKSEKWLTVGPDGYVVVPAYGNKEELVQRLPVSDSEPDVDQAVRHQKPHSLPRGAKLMLKATKKAGSLPNGDSSLQLFTEGEKKEKAKSKRPIRRSKSSDDPQKTLPPTLVINSRQDHTTHTVSKLAAPLPNHPSELVSRRSGPTSPTANRKCPPKPAPARPPPPKPKKPADDSTLQYDYVEIDVPRFVVGCTTPVQQKRAGIQESRTELENSEHVYEPYIVMQSSGSPEDDRTYVNEACGTSCVGAPIPLSDNEAYSAVQSSGNPEDDGTYVNEVYEPYTVMQSIGSPEDDQTYVNEAYETSCVGAPIPLSDNEAYSAVQSSGNPEDDGTYVINQLTYDLTSQATTSIATEPNVAYGGVQGKNRASIAYDYVRFRYS